jgi:CheY-like chemotaxis protein
VKNGNNLLLVEDSPDDAYFVIRAFQKVCAGVAVAHVRDGEAARQYLSGEGDFGDRARYPLPSLLLLDIKLPRISGLELLEWIRSAPDHRALPAVVLSSSDQSKDVARAGALGVLGYHIKPVDPSDLERVVSAICKSWKEIGGGTS